MWPDPLAILSFEIVGSVFLLGILVAQIMHEEIAKHHRQLDDEITFLTRITKPIDDLSRKGNENAR